MFSNDTRNKLMGTSIARDSICHSRQTTVFRPKEAHPMADRFLESGPIESFCVIRIDYLTTKTMAGIIL